VAFAQERSVLVKKVIELQVLPLARAVCSRRALTRAQGLPDKVKTLQVRLGVAAGFAHIG
jgi:hypothetical protein